MAKTNLTHLWATGLSIGLLWLAAPVVQAVPYGNCHYGTGKYDQCRDTKTGTTDKSAVTGHQSFGQQQAIDFTQRNRDLVVASALLGAAVAIVSWRYYVRGRRRTYPKILSTDT